MESMKLQDFLNDVKFNKLVLPDFQRKFVWNRDDMYGLFASVLCQMPFGSILTLESEDKAFSCKKFGAKPRVPDEHPELDDGSKPIEYEYLIDGQQRLTSLFAGFSTYYYTSFKNDPKDIATDQLLDMYFLKIPADSREQDADPFGAWDLQFGGNRTGNSALYFSSGEMKRVIDSEKVSVVLESKKFLDITNENHLQKVLKFCTNNVDGYYRIPLQFVVSEDDGVSLIFDQILEKIAVSFRGRARGRSVKLKVSEQRRVWASKVQKYLSECLNSLQLNKICVEKSDKSRAIDIYSNLNRGGVALSVFDLVMARVGTVRKENFYDTIIGYVQTPREYPDKLKNNKYINVDVPYDHHALEHADVLKKNDELAKEFINNFLTVLAIYLSTKEFGSFKADLNKEEYILAIDPDKICNSSEIVCKAMDRALFFFQTRCGVRRLSDINYKAQFALVAYFFTKDELFSDLRVHNIFEYWYWVSLFAYMYPSNQDVRIFKEIPFFEKYFKTFNKDEIIHHFESHEKLVLEFKHYSDRDTMTMSNSEETGRPPASVMTEHVCQFFLSKGYRDLVVEEENSEKKAQEPSRIDAMYKGALEIHHILPLGDSPKKTIGVTTKELRNDPLNPHNSPLNMLYISKESNKKISDLSFDRYIKDKKICGVLSTLGCFSDKGQKTSIDSFLGRRYESLYGTLTERLDVLKKSL